jgi:hypothetical protein
MFKFLDTKPQNGSNHLKSKKYLFHYSLTNLFQLKNYRPFVNFKNLYPIGVLWAMPIARILCPLIYKQFSFINKYVGQVKNKGKIIKNEFRLLPEDEESRIKVQHGGF